MRRSFIDTIIHLSFGFVNRFLNIIFRNRKFIFAFLIYSSARFPFYAISASKTGQETRLLTRFRNWDSNVKYDAVEFT